MNDLVALSGKFSIIYVHSNFLLVERQNLDHFSICVIQMHTNFFLLFQFYWISVKGQFPTFVDNYV